MKKPFFLLIMMVLIFTDVMANSKLKQMDDYLKGLKSNDQMKRNLTWGQIEQVVKKKKKGQWRDFVPLLKQSLNNEHVDVVRRAVVQLGKIKETSAVEKLISLLSHPNNHLKRGIIKSLGLIGEVKAFSALEALTDSGDERELIEAIARLDAPGSWAYVQARLKHEAQHTRNAACRAVERANYRKAIPTLLTMMDDKGLISIATDGGPRTTVADCVFDVLGKMKAKEALPIFKKMLAEGVNKGEVHALIEYGGAEVIGLTTEILESGTNEAGRANSASILRQLLIREKHSDEKVGPSLLKGLQDKSPLVRRDACFAVSETQYKPAIPVLIELLHDKTEISNGYRVDGYAFYALTKMRAKEAVPVFKEMMTGKDDRHRKLAAGGLRAIGGEEIRSFAKDLAKNHQNKNVRLESVRILGQLKEKEFLKALRSHEKATKVLELIKFFLP